MVNAGWQGRTGEEREGERKEEKEEKEEETKVVVEVPVQIKRRRDDITRASIKRSKPSITFEYDTVIHTI